MNNVKDVIQKEEYIALAINKYIAQNAAIPKKINGSVYELDWDKLVIDEYLGANFNKYNPILKTDIKVYFDSNNSAFIRGVLNVEADYNSDIDYLYSFYINQNFRVNTIVPSDKTAAKLVIGSQVLYSDLQRNIVNVLNKVSPEVNTILLPSQTCTASSYYYELKDNKLTYKYCKSDKTSLEVYQESPIYLESASDLTYVKSKIGSVAYVKQGGLWYEYYFQGGSTNYWVPTSNTTTTTTTTDTSTVESRVLSYIPDAKDLVIKEAGGCMLANGDIYCWGNNKYKKAGIENYGQLNTSLTPDYINTPVMLKVQINDGTTAGATRSSKNWYNNPYRIKFEKMFLNSRNVCGVSPIFDYTDNGVAYKFGGDLYCNGEITSDYFENIAIAKSETPILSRNKFLYTGKSDLKKNGNEIYIKDIAMTADTTALLSDTGKIYTFGKNYSGALGIGSDDKFLAKYEPTAVSMSETGIVFSKIFALRDLDCFGAIDTNNNFWIWGKRNSTVISYYNKPTRLNDSKKKYNSDYIFVNSSEFLLRSSDDNVYYRTNGANDILYVSSIPNTAISASIIEESDGWKYLYVNENLQLKGTQALLECRNKKDITCTADDNGTIFSDSLTELNENSNFFNVSIYKLDSTVAEQTDTFEDGTSNGWVLNTYNDTSFSNLKNSTSTNITQTNDNNTNDDNNANNVLNMASRVDPTRILGRFLIGYQSIEKTYDFGSSYANREVVMEFNFFEVDSWDMERFQVFLNGELLAEDGFIHDCHDYSTDTNDTGIYSLNLGTHYNSAISTCNNSTDKLYGSKFSKYTDEKYTYKLKSKLDAQGKLKVVMRVRNGIPGEYGYNSWGYGQDLNDESWAVDNISIKVKEINKHFTCAITGHTTDSQMYCWGNVGRSIPILSTSLYDMSKISTLNKLFITQESEKTDQMTYTPFNNSGYLFLKFPTYISGFDYPFYFK